MTAIVEPFAPWLRELIRGERPYPYGSDGEDARRVERGFGRFEMTASTLCPHVAQIRPVAPRTPEGCEECLRIGSPWIHLRLCLTCGHVGCCDSSPNRHARAHAYGAGHAIIRSFEPGEAWRWCYFDERFV